MEDNFLINDDNLQKLYGIAQSKGMPDSYEDLKSYLSASEENRRKFYDKLSSMGMPDSYEQYSAYIGQSAPAPQRTDVSDVEQAGATAQPVEEVASQPSTQPFQPMDYSPRPVDTAGNMSVQQEETTSQPVDTMAQQAPDTAYMPKDTVQMPQDTVTGQTETQQEAGKPRTAADIVKDFVERNHLAEARERIYGSGKAPVTVRNGKTSYNFSPENVQAMRDYQEQAYEAAMGEVESLMPEIERSVREKALFDTEQNNRNKDAKPEDLQWHADRLAEQRLALIKEKLEEGGVGKNGLDFSQDSTLNMLSFDDNGLREKLAAAYRDKSDVDNYMDAYYRTPEGKEERLNAVNNAEASLQGIKEKRSSGFWKTVGAMFGDMAISGAMAEGGMDYQSQEQLREVQDNIRKTASVNMAVNQQLHDAENTLGIAKKNIEEGNGNAFVKFGRGVRYSNLDNLIPVSELYGQMGILQLYDKLDANGNPKEQLTEEEQNLYEALAMNQYVQQVFGGDVNMLNRIGRGLPEQAAFTLQFLLSSEFAGAQTIGEGAAKALRRGISRGINREIKSGVGRFMLDKALPTAFGMGAETIYRTGLQLPSIMAGAIERHVGTLRIDPETGEVGGFEGGVDWGEALWKSTLSVANENFTELLGDQAFQPGWEWLARNTKAGKAVAAFREGLGQLGDGTVGEWLEAGANIRQKAGWAGWSFETLEEMAGSFNDAAFIHDQTWEQAFSKESVMETVLNCMIFGVVMGSTTNTVGSARNLPSAVETRNEKRKAAAIIDRMDGISTAEIDERIDTSSSNELAHWLVRMNRNGNHNGDWTDEQRTAVANYVKASVEQRAQRHFKGMRLQEDVKAMEATADDMVNNQSGDIINANFVVDGQQMTGTIVGGRVSAVEDIASDADGNPKKAFIYNPNLSSVLLTVRLEDGTKKQIPARDVTSVNDIVDAEQFKAERAAELQGEMQRSVADMDRTVTASDIWGVGLQSGVILPYNGGFLRLIQKLSDGRWQLVHCDAEGNQDPDKAVIEADDFEFRKMGMIEGLRRLQQQQAPQEEIDDAIDDIDTEETIHNIELSDNEDNIWGDIAGFMQGYVKTNEEGDFVVDESRPEAAAGYLVALQKGDIGKTIGIVDARIAELQARLMAKPEQTENNGEGVVGMAANQSLADSAAEDIQKQIDFLNAIRDGLVAKQEEQARMEAQKPVSQMQRGESFPVLFNGQEATAIVREQNTDGNGNVLVDIVDAEDEPIAGGAGYIASADELEGMRVRQTESEQKPEPESEPEPATIQPAPAPTPQGPAPAAPSGAQPVSQNETPEPAPIPSTSEVAPSMEIPRDKDGKADYDQITDPYVYAAALTEEFGDEAVDVVNALVESEEAALEGANQIKDTIKRFREQRESKARLERFRKVRDLLTAPQEGMQPTEHQTAEGPIEENSGNQGGISPNPTVEEAPTEQPTAETPQEEATKEEAPSETPMEEETEQTKEQPKNNINDEQTGTDTEAVASQAEAVASQAESDAENITTEQQGNEIAAAIDEQLDKVNEQLALLGYYEADKEDGSKWDKVYGFSKTAEKKALKDAENLAKRIAKDLGIDVGKKKLAKANFAPACGDITFRIPLPNGFELYFNLYFNPDGYDSRYGYSDNLKLNGIMFRIENPAESGYKQYVGSNQNESTDVTYDDLIRRVRYEVKSYVPNFEIKPIEEKPSKKNGKTKVSEMVKPTEQKPSEEAAPLSLADLRGETEQTKPTDEAVAAANEEVDTNPTEAQKEAGNYKKGHVTIDGFDISIENPAGSTRSGTDAQGNPWSVTMHNSYGYIRMTEGVDGDHIDIFLSDHIDDWNGTVYVVDQVNAAGSFDEHKVMYGFNSAEEAREAYLSNYSEGWQGLGTITGVSREEFKKWVDSSHRKTKAFADYKSVQTTEGQNEAALATQQTEQPADATPTESAYGANNKLVSTDQYEELKRRMKEKLRGQANAGFDPEILSIGVQMAMYHIEAGARKFADFAKRMIDDLGDAIRPYLQGIYENARRAPGMEELRKAMDSTETVDNFDVENFDKGEAQDKTDTNDNGAHQYTEKQKKDFSEAVTVDMRLALERGEKPYRSINDIRKRAESVGMEVDKEGRDDILLQELVEDGLVRAARQVIESGRFGGAKSKEAFDAICKLYEMQPTISMRSSNRVKMQQYSTPLPMAFVADMFAYKGGKVLEPTAGNGMLVFAIPSKNVTVNELDETRLANLREQGFPMVLNEDALTVRFVGMYDSVIANPPFGSSPAKDYDGKMISGLDEQITLNALSAMKDDGRAAIIIGGNMEYGKNGGVAGNRAFWTYLYDHYNVKGVVDMEGKLYGRQGTTYPTRMILIDGRRSEEERAQTAVYPPVKEKAVRKAESFDDLYDIVTELLSLPNKTNGNEVLRDKPPVSDNNGTQGQTGVQRRGEESDENDSDVGGRDGRGNGVERTRPNAQGEVRPTKGDSGSVDVGSRPSGLHGAQSPQYRTEREPVVPDSGTTERPGRGANDGGSTESKPNGEAGRVSDGGVQDVGTPVQRVGLTQPKEQEKRTLTEEKLPYRQHNSAFSLESVAPAAMVEAMDKALTEIEKTYGKSIDEFVTDELGYDSVEDMHNALAAEQVDSVAMAIHQMKQGQAMIIGDQTGVGKGRQMAALIRWAHRQGKKPIFVTQKAFLFSDIYRDLVDVGSGELRPFIFNSYINPKKDEYGNEIHDDKSGEMLDADGNLVYRAPTDAKQKKIFESGELPDEYDFAVLTYSQVNTGDAQSREEARKAAKEKGERTGKKEENPKPSPKADFLRKIANDNYMFLDESHTAAGDSKSGAYLQSLLRDAKAATFASATFAKRPDTMPLYAVRTAMSKANVKQDELIGIIKKGGVTLQEIMSRALTEAGQMVRRERDMSDVKTDWITIEDPKTVAKSRKDYDKTIAAFNAIIKFQNDYVKPMIAELSGQLAATASSADVKKGTDNAGIRNVPFASKTYNYTKQLMLALKVDAIVDKVVEEIEAGRHPVIALESTMEASIKEYKIGDVIEEPTFSGNLLRGLDAVMQYTIKDENGKDSHRRYTPKELGEEGERAYYELQDFIRESTKGIFISPLDAIISKLSEKGYKVGELTGRNVYVDTDEQGRFVVKKRTDKDKKRMMREFNSGALDVLILNKSASTGISLHASNKFSDQRQRTMVIAQPLSDINDYMQMIGRIDRTGQVHRGYYINLGLPVPAENRFLMMLSTKLKSLNANTTTSQESESNSVEAPDLLNKYGSKVVVEYLRDNPEIYVKMGEPISKGMGQKVSVKELDDYEAPENDDVIRTITGYVALLSTKEQDEFYNDVVQRYNDLIKYLDDTGTNDLKITVMPLKAKTLEKKVSSKGVDPNGSNPFAKDAYVETVEMDVLRKPMKADDVRKTIEQLNTPKGTEHGHLATAAKEKSVGDRVMEIIGTVQREAQEKLQAENERYEEAKKKAVEDIEKQRAKINKQQKRTDEEKAEAIEKFITDTNAKVEEQHGRNVLKIEALSELLEDKLTWFKVGGSYLMPDVLESESLASPELASPAIFCGYKAKDSKITSSTTFAVFATLDGRRRIEVKLSDNAAAAIGRLTSDNYDTAQEVTLDNWDSKIPTNTRKTGYIMTGNILQAVKDTQDPNDNYPGQLVSYTDEEGNVHDGILMPDKWKPGMMKNSGKPINFPPVVSKILNGELVKSTDGKVSIYGSGWAKTYTLTVPKTKKEGGVYFENPVILKSVSSRGFWQNRGEFRADINGEDNMRAVVNELAKLGVRVSDEQQGDGEVMYRSSDELFEQYPTWLSGQTTDTGQHTTQITSTVKTYEHIGDWMKEQGMDGAKVLDASSGLGTGTFALRDMGFDVDDVEPYPSEKREAPTYTRYEDVDGEYDVVISNAVLNVIPDDWRADVLKSMADKVKVGGKLIINVRDAKSIESQKQKIELDSPSEILVTDSKGNIRAYQKGFTKQELKQYVEDELGEGWQVEIANEKNSGLKSGTAVVVTRTNEAKPLQYREIEREYKAGEMLPITKGNDGYRVEGLNDSYPNVGRLLDAWRDSHPDYFAEVRDGQLYVEPWNLGEGRTARERRHNQATAERQWRRAHERANDTINKLGLQDRVTILDSTEGLTGKRKKAKGWFDTKTGKIVIVMPNHNSPRDVVKTIIHEGVAHYGLRKLVGEKNMNEFLDRVFEAADKEVRGRIIDLAMNKYDRNFRKATEEYLAGLAEGTNFDNPTFLEKVKALLVKLLDKMGIQLGNGLTDNELRYILWKSYRNLVADAESLTEVARDAAMQSALEVGNFSPAVAAESRAREDDDFDPDDNGGGGITPEQDAAYMDAVRRGDMETAQRMVMEAAKAAMPNTKVVDENGNPLVVYHGRSEQFNTFERRKGVRFVMGLEDEVESEGFFFSPDKDFAEQYAANAERRRGGRRETIPTFLNIENPLDLAFTDNFAQLYEEVTGYEYQLGMDDITNLWEIMDIEGMADKIKAKGYDGVIFAEERAEDGTVTEYSYCVFDPSQIKSADPVTYDDQGNVIPLSQRFNEEDDDIRFRDAEPANKVRDEFDEISGAHPKDKAETLRQKIETFLTNQVNKFRPLKQLEELMAKTIGRNVRDSEAVYSRATQMAGRTLAQMEAERETYLTPLSQAVNDVLDIIDPEGRRAKRNASLHGLKYEAMEEVRQQLSDYLIAKHGLERSEWFYQQKLAEFEEKKKDPAWLAAQQAKYDALSDDKKASMTFEEYIDNKKPKWKDMGGLTGLAESLGEDTKKHKQVAENLVKEFEKKIGKEAIGKLWGAINDFNNRNLEIQYESGRKTKEEYEELKARHQYYVPLTGFDEETSDDRYTYEGNVQTLGDGLYRAKGRRSKPADPLVAMMHQQEHDVIWSNDNWAKDALLNAAINMNSDLLSVSQSWYVYNDETEEWEERLPEVDDTMSADKRDAVIKQFEADMKDLQSKKKAKRHRGRLNVGVRVLPKRESQHEVEVWRGGKRYIVYVNGNPSVVRAYSESQKELDNFTKGLAKANRIEAQLFTTYNPEFAVKNMMRDTNFALFSAYVLGGRKQWWETRKNIDLSRRVLPHLMKDGTVSEKQVKDHAERQQLEQWYKEFIENGGETGFTRMMSAEQMSKDLNETLFELVTNGKNALTKMEDLAEKVQTLNRWAENSTRFAAYITARQKGESVRKSMDAAKNSTLNFNIKGYEGRRLRAWFAFFNARLQGVAQLARLASGNKQQKLRFAAGLGAAVLTGAMVPFLNILLMGLFGDDDDWRTYENLSEFTGNNNLILFIPGIHKFIQIPYAQELAPFSAIGNIWFREAMGWNRNKSAWQQELEMALAYLPMEVSLSDKEDNSDWWLSTLARTASPTILQPTVEYLVNENFMNMPLRRDNKYKNDLAAWTRAYENRTSSALINASKWLNGGGSKNKWGKFEFLIDPSFIQHVVEGTAGGAGSFIGNARDLFTEPDWFNHLPFVRKFMFDSAPKKWQAGLDRAYSSYAYDLVEKYDGEIDAIRNDNSSSLEYAREMWEKSNSTEAELRKTALYYRDELGKQMVKKKITDKNGRTSTRDVTASEFGNNPYRKKENGKDDLPIIGIHGMRQYYGDLRSHNADKAEIEEWRNRINEYEMQMIEEMDAVYYRERVQNGKKAANWVQRMVDNARGKDEDWWKETTDK